MRPPRSRRPTWKPGKRAPSRYPSRARGWGGPGLRVSGPSYRGDMLFRDPVVALLGPLRCLSCRAPDSMLCPGCAARQASPREDPVAGVDRVLVPWAYEGAARALILALKLQARRPAAEPLVEAMWGEVGSRGLCADVITWVPGRPADIRRRGFDHAEVLARGLAAGTGLPARPLLARARVVRDQAGLGASERRANLVGAFVPVGSVPSDVVLVDDVITSGATGRSCASALRRGGAGVVEMVAAARA